MGRITSGESLNGKDGLHGSRHDCKKSNKMIDNMPMLIFLNV